MEEKELRELAELTKGKVFPNKKTEGPYYIMNGGKKPLPFFADQYNTLENTITISAVGHCGYVHFHRVKFWINDCGFKLLNIDKNINVLFLFHCLKNKEKEMMNLKRGTSIPYISRNDLYKFRVKHSLLPSKNKKK